MSLQRTTAPPVEEPSAFRPRRLDASARTDSPSPIGPDPTASPWIWGRPGRAAPRGPLSLAVMTALTSPPGSLGPVRPSPDVDAVDDGDFHLALFLCLAAQRPGSSYPGWEHDDDLRELRHRLQRTFVERIRDESRFASPIFAGDPAETVAALLDHSAASPVVAHLSRFGSLDQLREYVVHRSVQRCADLAPETGVLTSMRDHLAREGARPHVARRGALGPSPDMALAEAVAVLNLDPSLGAYVGRVPGITIASANLSTILDRCDRTSVAAVGVDAVSNRFREESWRKLPLTFGRFGISPPLRPPRGDGRVKGTADHAASAALTRSMRSLDQAQRRSLLFGVIAALYLERRFSRHVLKAWTSDRPSLVDWTPTAQYPLGY